LSLSFEDNGKVHNDLVLSLDEFVRRCDSYYLALDSDLLPERRDADKVRAVLIRLLEQWAEAVRELPDGGVTFLPYEFDDEASGWLQVTAIDKDNFDVLPVWSTLEGWAFNPSAHRGEARERLGRTEPVQSKLEPQRMSRDDLMSKIAESIAAAHGP
jgi:hypothetical protein